MRLIIFLSYLAIQIFFVNCFEKARYDNYRVYKIKIENEVQLRLLQEIEKFPNGVSEAVNLKSIFNTKVYFKSFSIIF
jgi:hypothetical protein